ncbi:expressed unknown protein [Seminavis robusta]|uniref:Uncharacterized protein n=1 Tax=Seminavis robusta TaxID=568900 RepID=A0A9N8HES5_9STRA|nr:expressed unknown protein [Seminavis robusta]|eukprot:Sro424_g139900.1 n/a (699) ;mRNA; f:16588-18791
MRRLSILFVSALFLLLVARHEVSAKNYLLWALGLEEDEEQAHDVRMLKKYNEKARARVSDNRLRRRTYRRGNKAADMANVSPQTRTIRIPVTTRKDDKGKKTSAKKNEAVPIQQGKTEYKRHKTFNLRDKVADKLSHAIQGKDKKQKQVQYVGAKDNSRSNRGGRQKNKEPKQNAKHQGSYRPGKEVKPAGNNRSKNDRGKQKEDKQKDHKQKDNKKRSEKRFKTKLDNKRSRAGGDKPRGDGGANRHHNKRTAERHHRTEETKREEHNQIKRQQEHAAANSKHTSTATSNGGRNHNKRLEKHEKEKRAEKNAEKRQEEHAARTKQAIGTIDVTMRNGNTNVGGSAGFINARTRAQADAQAKKGTLNKKKAVSTGANHQRNKKHVNARRKEEHFERKALNHRNHKAEKAGARRKHGNKRHSRQRELLTTLRMGVASQHHKHHQGYNKRKQQRIQREKAGLNRRRRGHKDMGKPQVDTVTLRDGGLDMPTIVSVGDANLDTKLDTIDLSSAEMKLDNTGATIPVVSLYWGIFNSPDACPQQPCKLEDALNPNTKASIIHGTGNIPDADGNVILVASIYRTPEHVDYSGPALLDGLALETNGALSSAGFYNKDASVVIGIRKVASAVNDSMAQLLEATEFVESMDLYDDFVQFSSFKAGQTGFEAVQAFGTGDIVEGAKAHLTRQNDVLQIYVETNVQDA